jgi:hypothetical protein
MDLCGKAGNYQKLLDFCRSRGDELGFAAALVSKSSQPAALARAAAR